MNILIFEENLEDAKHLSDCLGSYFIEKDIEYNIDIVNESCDFIDKTDSYDLFCLDIGDEKESGIDVGIKIRDLNKDAIIIFVTKYTKYLIDGYKAQANRYFIKPIKQQEFKLEIDNILQKYINRYSGFYDLRIQDTKIYYNDIIYVDYYNRKTRIHFISGKVYETKDSFKCWIDRLKDYHFVQSYKSYLVNLSYVDQVICNEIVLNTREIVPLSRLFKKEFELRYSANLN